MQHVFDTGHLAGTGYLSILPVDQGVEHSAAASFAPNPAYFDPVNLCESAVEAGCNAIASTIGVLGMTSRRYAHRIPFIAKLNHNQLLTYPNSYDQVMFASVKQAFDLGAVAVGATVYFGAPESMRQLQEVREAFAHAHELGMFTVLWAYLRNPAFKRDGTDYHVSADLTGQANHLAATVEADIVKQRQPENNGGFRAMGFGKTDDRVYGGLTTDLTRWQVANCYRGRASTLRTNQCTPSPPSSAAARARRLKSAALAKNSSESYPYTRPAPGSSERSGSRRHRACPPSPGRARGSRRAASRPWLSSP